MLAALLDRDADVRYGNGTVTSRTASPPALGHGPSIGRARPCDTVKVPPPASSRPRPPAGDGPQGTHESREIPMLEPEPAQDVHAEDADRPTTAETETETDEAAVYANRAARRAKGKVASPQPYGKGQHPGGRSSVQSPRQWGNRRSG